LKQEDQGDPTGDEQGPEDEENDEARVLFLEGIQFVFTYQLFFHNL
jgi:hypothetical protein